MCIRDRVTTVEESRYEKEGQGARQQYRRQRGKEAAELPRVPRPPYLLPVGQVVKSGQHREGKGQDNVACYYWPTRPAGHLQLGGYPLELSLIHISEPTRL